MEGLRRLQIGGSTYLVSYDLSNKPQSAYDRLIEALESDGASRVLESLWAVNADSSSWVLGRYKGYLAPDDRLFVARLESEDWLIEPPSLEWKLGRL